MPFIAITERAFATLVNEQYDVLWRGGQVHERLERWYSRAADWRRSSARSPRRSGAAMVLDASGGELARHPAGRRRPRSSRSLAGRGGQARRRRRPPPSSPQLAGRACAALRCLDAGAARSMAWLIVVSRAAPWATFRAPRARQGAMVVGLRADARAGGAGDGASPRGRPAARGARRPARRAGSADGSAVRASAGPAAVLVFELHDPPAARLAEFLGESRPSGLVAPRLLRRELLCAVVDGAKADPIESAQRPSSLLTRPTARCGASRFAPSVGARSPGLPRGPLRPRGDFVGQRRGSRRGLSPGPRSLHPVAPLQDAEALRPTARACWAHQIRGRYGEGTPRSLEAYIDEQRGTGSAASRLYCHRHTLRYRSRGSRSSPAGTQSRHRPGRALARAPSPGAGR